MDALRDDHVEPMQGVEWLSLIERLARERLRLARR